MAGIIGSKDLDFDTTYIDSLKYEDHMLLRRVVKKIHMHYYPEEMYTDLMADMLISKFGPQYGEDLLKKAIDAGLKE